MLIVLRALAGIALSRQERLALRRYPPQVADVAFGSFASVWPRTDDFRSTPVNRHRYRASGCLKCSILLQKSFWGDERKFLGPLIRFVCGDVRDLIVSYKTTTALRIATFATISANSGNG